jgi:shikimate kinase
MNVVLIGYRGCGKSAVGRELAARLGWPFVDTDVLIERRAGLTIRQIFADWAEQGFRALEAAVIAEVAALDQHVISTGGGAVLQGGNAVALKRGGRMVWLTAPPEVLWQRIVNDWGRPETRPRMDLAAGLQQVREALRERGPIYKQLADVTVDTTDQPIHRVVERILARAHLRELAGDRHSR